MPLRVLWSLKLAPPVLLQVIKQRDHNIQRLKDSQKHLEGFRYVLFHKVQDLEEERGPLGSQVKRSARSYFSTRRHSSCYSFES